MTVATASARLFNTSADRRRWATLAVVCLAQLMIVLDVTIVNVALPSIERDLEFSPGNLTWVVNAFLVTFGSLLLLTGRLGDLVGRKRVFLGGLVMFMAASLLCGLAPTEEALIGARFLQGIGAAAQASVILAIIVTEFPEAVERARAMSAYVFVSVAGGSLGLLAGGLLTEALSWHWVFFVNLPIGAATFALGLALIRADRGLGLGQGVDWLGSLLVTASLVGAIYAIVEATSHGWLSARGARRRRHRRAADGGLPRGRGPRREPDHAAAHPPAARTGQRESRQGLPRHGDVLDLLPRRALSRARPPLQRPETGAAFLPWTLTVAVLSQGITARLVDRFGAWRVLTGGMASALVGLLLFATVGPDTPFFPTIFFACFAIGLGIGTAFMPLLTIAMADVPPEDAGLGSGITNVSQQIGGAFGLAVLSTIAANHTKELLSTDHGLTSSLVDGYQLAFITGAVVIGAGIVLALILLRPSNPQPEPSVNTTLNIEDGAT